MAFVLGATNGDYAEGSYSDIEHPLTTVAEGVLCAVACKYTCSACTYNGNSMTLHGNFTGNRLFSILGPYSVTNGSVDPTNGYQGIGQSYALKGLKDTSSLVDSDNATGYGRYPSLTLSGAAGNLAIAVCNHTGETGHSMTVGGVSILDRTHVVGNANSFSIGHMIMTGASIQIDWNCGESEDYQVSAWVLEPAADAAVEVRKYRRTRWNSYPYRRDRLGPVNIGGGAVGKGLWVPPGYNQLAVPGRQM